MAEWRYSSVHSYSRHWMEVHSQIHAPAALSAAKQPLVPTEQEAYRGYRAGLDAVKRTISCLSPESNLASQVL